MPLAYGLAWIIPVDSRQLAIGNPFLLPSLQRQTANRPERDSLEQRADACVGVNLERSV